MIHETQLPAERPMKRDEAAAYITEAYAPCSKSYLEKLASVGGGPEFFHIGRRAVYLRTNLDAWVRSRISPPTHSRCAE